MPPPSKRRKTESTAIQEITFDITARQDYLTGFHKRKLQRAKHAQEIAEKKARADRIEERRKACLQADLREERKQDLHRHVAEINALLKPMEQDIEAASSVGEGDDQHEWIGLTEPPEVDHEAEYIDEDRYTTVTVEAMDLSRDGLREAEKQANQDADSPIDKKQKGANLPSTQRQGKRIWRKELPEKEGRAPKKKRKKFRYENKAERRFTRMKERSKNSTQAKARRSD